MKQFVILLVLFLSLIGYSQTKLIAHRSHSGSDQSFAVAVQNELFNGDNLGLGRMEIQEVNNLDSIVYLSNDKVIAYSSNYTQRYYPQYDKKCSRDELTKLKIDTLHIKPKLFKKGLTILDVKATIDKSKMYNNDLSLVKYKDFDDKIKRKKNRKSKSFLPFLANFPNFPNSFFLIGILGFLSILVYLISSTFRFKKLIFVN